MYTLFIPYWNDWNDTRRGGEGRGGDVRGSERWVRYRGWSIIVSEVRCVYNQRHAPSHTLSSLVPEPFFCFGIVWGVQEDVVRWVSMKGLVAMVVLGGGASCRLYMSLVAVSWVGMMVAYMVGGGILEIGVWLWWCIVVMVWCLGRTMWQNSLSRLMLSLWAITLLRWRPSVWWRNFCSCSYLWVRMTCLSDVWRRW